VPADTIIDVLDEEEDVLASKLNNINEAIEPDKDILNASDESDANGLEFESDDDEENDDGMDNGIKD